MFSFDCRRRDATSIVGFNRDERDDVDSVDARSTGSEITHVLNCSLK